MNTGTRQKLFLFLGAVVLIAATIAARQFYVSRPAYGLPFYARFTPDAEDRWTALGGTWEVADGSMRNDSNDRGAKLLSASSNWKNYVLEGDFQLLGTGSVGVLARITEAELGENSFKGYFAGIRTGDNSLVLGSYDFAYHEVAKVTMPNPVRAFLWYHIKVAIDGCRIAVSGGAIGMQPTEIAPLNDPECYRSGSVGLRSNGTGGIWRNVTVVPVGSADTRAHIATTNPLPAGSPQAGAAPGGAESVGHLQRVDRGEQWTPSVPIQPVLSMLYLTSPELLRVAIRGSVVLTRPAIYVQDSTGGGVEVEFDGAPSLKIGDEVEVEGERHFDHFSPVIRHAQFRLLGETVPVSPLVLESGQVAGGAYDGRFVQVDGYLHGISEQKDGSGLLSLSSGTQSFHAILPAGRSRSHLKRFALESRLRLRGVTVVDARFNRASDPFVILVRSAEDVDVVAGPPWWRPSTLIATSLAVLGLIFGINHLFLLVKHWRLRAVADERERLAHEIHDTLAQSFAGIGFQLQAIRNSIPPDARFLEREVDRAMSMTRTSHEEARRSITSLRPASLGQTGLLPALRECAERMVKSGKVTVETQGEETIREVPLHIKDTLFRIGQEAIANSIRHADPDTIRIRLQYRRSALCLSVEDDGAGFIADSDHAGFGLRGMRKRAESISASLVINSAPGSGTQVEVRTTVGSRLRRMARNSRN